MIKPMIIRLLLLTVVMTQLSSLGYGAIDNTLLKQFAGVYPQLFRSALTPVSYSGSLGLTPESQSKLMSQLLSSYRNETQYDELAELLEADSAGVIKSDAEINALMQSIGLTKADYDMLMYQLSENPAVLKQFAAYLQGSNGLQLLAYYQQELPSYGQLLPTKEHRKVYFELMEFVKNQQQAKPITPVMEATPGVKPAGSQLPVRQPFSSVVWFGNPTS